MPDTLPSLQQTPVPDALWNSPFLKACRRESTEVTPIWLMRQAGRYMAEYRAIRSKVSFLELCKRPDLATEVTVTAAEVLGVDAAILFADILLILQPLGFVLEFAKGEGPVIHNPLREPRDVDRVRPLENPSPLSFVYQAVSSIRAAPSLRRHSLASPGLRSPWHATPSKEADRATTRLPRPSCTAMTGPGTLCWLDWLIPQ